MKNELSTNVKEKTMTTKEVAEQLKTSPKVILTNAKKCLPNKIIKNGKPTYWTKEEVTILLDYMKSNKQTLFNSQAKQPFTDELRSISTDLTPALKLKKALDLAQEAYEEELERIKAEKLQLQQQNENLQIELDQSKEYITIKRMEKLNPTEHFNWRLLKKESERLRKPSKDVFDANYGNVKAYHVSVWESLYFDSINYPA